MESEIEIWKDIKGYEGLYSISNLGKIKSYSRKSTHKETIILKPQKNIKGYLFVNLCKEGTIKLYLVHRLLAIHFIDNPNNYPLINHEDGIKINNNLNNLKWCTASYNIQHSYDNKLQTKRGVKTSTTILNENLVKEIREKHNTLNMSKKDLAKLYKVSLPSIYDIIARRTWNWEGI